MHALLHSILHDESNSTPAAGICRHEFSTNIVMTRAKAANVDGTEKSTVASFARLSFMLKHSA